MFRSGASPPSLGIMASTPDSCQSRPVRCLVAVGQLFAAAVVGTSVAATTPQTSVGEPVHGQASEQLVITNAMVIYGNGRPPFGPVDIVVEDGLITRVGDWTTGSARIPDAVIDATGKYVMPGIVNTHMHWHEWRVPSIAQPIQYERNLYLAAGVTTVREVGGNFRKSKRWQAESETRAIVSPRILVYPRPNLGPHRTPQEIRLGVRQAKLDGADGLKIGGLDRDQLEALLDEAQIQGLRTAAHIGVEETTAADYVELGVDSIEHFYGIGDVAIDAGQNFPADMNYSDETHRFAHAGELFAQADPDALRAVMKSMIAHNVGWSPTLSIYEANRDVVRAQNLPWYRDYLHPSMEEFWKPNPDHHGSYFSGWTSSNEAAWRRNYRIWMEVLKHFGRHGGLITTGDDAGYIYSLYGFGLIRELELHEEAGFHPLVVLKHATVNGAKMLGLADRLGRVRVGYLADLLVVNGNPLQNLRLLNPYGTSVNVAGHNTHGGGIEWTIKDGVPYHVPTLMDEVRQMVDDARNTKRREVTAGHP